MIEILYEDKHIVVVIKPSNVPMQKDFSRTKDMCTILSEYRMGKGEEVFIGLVHRLDRHVSGILVFAKTKEALKALNRQMQEKKVGKTYYAYVWNEKGKEETQESMQRKNITLEHYMTKQKKVAIVYDEVKPDAKKAVLHYQVVAQNGGQQLLKVALETGRFHQIRAQLAYVGLPIIGDPKYGVTSVNGKKIEKIGLQSAGLAFIHPKTKKEMRFFHFHTEEPFETMKDIVEAQ